MLTRRSLVVVLMSACLLALPGCNGFFTGRVDEGGGTSNGKFVYVALAAPVGGTGGVAAYRLDQSAGTLTLIGLPSDVMGDPHSVIADSGSTRVYVTAEDASLVTGGISPMQISRTDGSLSMMELPSSATVSAQTFASVVDPSGNYVFSISQTQRNIAVFHVVGSTLELANTYPLGNVAPVGLTLDSTGRLLYVASDTDGMYAYTVSNGQLTLAKHVLASNGLASRGVAITPSGKYVYVSNGATTGGVDVYSASSNGDLTPITTTVTGGSQPGPLLVDPSGNYLYVVNTGSNRISAFSISSDGTLTAVSGSPFAAGNGANAIAVDPSGYFVYVTNYNDKTISIFKIGSSGELATAGYIGTSSNPVSVVVTE